MKKARTGYTGWHGEKVEETGPVGASEFFERFVAPRKPVKVVGAEVIDPSQFSLDNITDFLSYQNPLQVEKKVDHGFGSALERVYMSLEELVNRLKQDETEYYLTTQYEKEEDDENEEEDEERDDGENEGQEWEEEEEVDEEEIENNEEKENGAEPRTNSDSANGDFSAGEEHFASEKFGFLTEKSRFQNGDSDFKTGEGFDFENSDADSFDLDNLKDDFDDFADEMVEDEMTADEMLDELLQLRKYEAVQRVKELLQAPLTNLRHKIPMRPSLIDSLVPQQINLWMGAAGEPVTIDPENLGRAVPGNGTSSGLHHDHADNLYILISGRKRFTLYPPLDAPNLYTVGEVHKVFGNGTIEYGIDSIREDGSLVSNVSKWERDKRKELEKRKALEKGNEVEKGNEIEISKSELLNLDRETEKEAANEFDNDSDSESEGRIELLELYGEETEHKTDESDDDKNLGNVPRLAHSEATSVPEPQDPPSFSRIPPALLHLDQVDQGLKEKLTRFTLENFPDFVHLQKLEVWLEPGQLFYLPAGWFHEVTSLGGQSLVHIAVNYWFAPPDSGNYQNPYMDGYWQEDWSRTLASLNLIENPEEL